jgi:hypothetical protein
MQILLHSVQLPGGGFTRHAMLRATQRPPRTEAIRTSLLYWSAVPRRSGCARPASSSFIPVEILFVKQVTFWSTFDKMVQISTIKSSVDVEKKDVTTFGLVFQMSYIFLFHIFQPVTKINLGSTC